MVISSTATAISSGAVIGTLSQSVDVHGNLWFHQ